MGVTVTATVPGRCGEHCAWTDYPVLPRVIPWGQCCSSPHFADRDPEAQSGSGPVGTCTQAAWPQSRVPDPSVPWEASLREVQVGTSGAPVRRGVWALAGAAGAELGWRAGAGGQGQGSTSPCQQRKLLCLALLLECGRSQTWMGWGSSGAVARFTVCWDVGEGR